MKVQIERFSILRTSAVLAAVYFIFGILFGLIGTLGGGLMGRWAGEGSMDFGFGAIGMLVGLPILYAIVGFIVTALFCFLYNIAAGIVGGIEMTLSEQG